MSEEPITTDGRPRLFLPMAIASTFLAIIALWLAINVNNTTPGDPIFSMRYAGCNPNWHSSKMATMFGDVLACAWICFMQWYGYLDFYNLIRRAKAYIDANPYNPNVMPFPMVFDLIRAISVGLVLVSALVIYQENKSLDAILMCFAK